MLFTSGLFIFLYLPATLLLFFVLARLLGRAVAAGWLVLASLVFYGYWYPPYTWLLVASITANYLFGSAIFRARRRGGRFSKAVLAATVGANLALLAYYKYSGFFLETLNSLSGAQLDVQRTLLPLGISFFTFTQIAYLVDVHAGKVEERNPVHYALFVTWFPHLIAGPVLHHAEMMPQFRNREIYSPHLLHLTLGLSFFVIGLLKKILLADSAAPIANAAFDRAQLEVLGSAEAWAGVMAYSLQIYFDFSGYSDMAIGLSLLIGVRLPYNFNSPYKARSIIEFWRRWHITLSRFLRDYLYIALGGNRSGKGRRYANLMITMLLGGLWHGASWTFVIWGGLHGFYLMVNHAWIWLRGRIGLDATGAYLQKRRVLRWFGQTGAIALTLGCVIVAWVFFRAASVGTALSMLASMAGLQEGAATRAAFAPTAMTAMLVLFAIALLVPNSQELIDQRLRPWLLKINANPRWQPSLAALTGAYTVAIVLLAAVAASRSVTEFIYFNF